MHPTVLKRQIESSKEGNLPPDADLTFENFSDLVDYLLKFVNFDLEVAKGVIDQFTRTRTVSAFLPTFAPPRIFGSNLR